MSKMVVGMNIEPAIDSVWPDLGFDVHPYNDLRHDLGSSLLTGSSRHGLRVGGDALSYGSVWLDHWLSFAWSTFGSSRSSQTSNSRFRHCVVRMSGVDSLWTTWRASTLCPGSRYRDRVWCCDVALHGDQRGQPTAVRWYGHGRRQFY